METRRILWAIVFGSMLAITGCGDDANSNGGSAGARGTGGPGGTANSSCEAICGGTCLFGGIAPGVGFDQCLAACVDTGLDDNCGAEMTAYLNCLTTNDCNFAALDCLSQAENWSNCNDPPM